VASFLNNATGSCHVAAAAHSTVGIGPGFTTARSVQRVPPHVLKYILPSGQVTLPRNALEDPTGQWQWLLQQDSPTRMLSGMSLGRLSSAVAPQGGSPPVRRRLLDTFEAEGVIPARERPWTAAQNEVRQAGRARQLRQRTGPFRTEFGESLRDIKEHDVGPMNVVCEECQALRSYHISAHVLPPGNDGLSLRNIKVHVVLTTHYVASTQ
jgi:hypothetical protein